MSEIVTIPKQFMGFEVIKVLARSKRPEEKEWQFHTYSIDHPEMVAHLNAGGNWGIVPRNGLCCMDIDDVDAFKKLCVDIDRKFPETYMDKRKDEATGHNRFHAYFICRDVPDHMKTKHATIYGDIRLGGNFYMVGTNSVAPINNDQSVLLKYELAHDVPIATIKYEDIKPFIVSLKPVETTEYKQTFTMPEGKVDQRHPTLISLVGSLVSKGLTYQAIEAACIAENQTTFNPPKPHDVIIKEVSDAYTYCMRKRAVKEVEKVKKAEEVEKSKAVDNYYKNRASLTEIDAAQGFYKYLDGDFLYNASSKRWHMWNGKCWEIDIRNAVFREAEKFLQGFYGILTDLPPEIREESFKKIQALNSRNGVNNVVALAAHQATVLAEDFDKDPDLFNVQNGSIVFEENGFVFKQHEKSDMCSLIANVEYNPDVGVPGIWTQHISTVMNGESKLIENLQFMLGYSLQDGNSLERFMFWIGTGRNGKSVTERVVSHIFGSYSLAVNPVVLMQSNSKSASPERRKMRGRRFITSQESNRPEEKGADLNASFDTGFIKACTGKDLISNRDLHQNNPEEFYVKGMITLSTNALPRITDTTPAFWDRLVVIPFHHYFEENDRDPTMETKLKEVSTGILNWMLDGWTKYNTTKRFVACDVIREMVDEYREGADEYALFVRDCVERKPGTDTLVSDLYYAYTEWLKFTNQHEGRAQKTFNKDMASRFAKRRKNTGVCYIDIALKPEGFSFSKKQ